MADQRTLRETLAVMMTRLEVVDVRTQTTDERTQQIHDRLMDPDEGLVAQHRELARDHQALKKRVDEAEGRRKWLLRTAVGAAVAGAGATAWGSFKSMFAGGG